MMSDYDLGSEPTMSKLECDLLDVCLVRSAERHSHLCPRQVLGVRIGLYALRLLGLEHERKDKQLFVFMETDGCAADGVEVATNCSVGRRTMRMVDYGRVAATFVDQASGRAIRLSPRHDVREASGRYMPDAKTRWLAYLEAYKLIPSRELVAVQPVELTVSLRAIISKAGIRVNCEACGEEIFNGREVRRQDKALCRACAGESYYTPSAQPHVLRRPTCASMALAVAD